MSGYALVKTEKGTYGNDSCPAGVQGVAIYNSGATESITDVSRRLCEWFYGELPTRIRQIHPSFNELVSKCFAENVQLECIYNINGHNKLDCTGVKMIIWVLYGIFREENLSFSPNVDLGGLRTEHDRHGILTVEVSGTVHKENSYIGIFDHTFKIVRCPKRQEFIIAYVKLNMKP